MNKNPVNPIEPLATPVMAVDGEVEVGDQEEEERLVRSDQDEAMCGPVEPESDGDEVTPHRTFRNPVVPTQKDKEDHRHLHWP